MMNLFKKFKKKHDFKFEPTTFDVTDRLFLIELHKNGASVLKEIHNTLHCTCNALVDDDFNYFYDYEDCGCSMYFHVIYEAEEGTKHQQTQSVCLDEPVILKAGDDDIDYTVSREETVLYTGNPADVKAFLEMYDRDLNWWDRVLIEYIED